MTTVTKNLIPILVAFTLLFSSCSSDDDTTITTPTVNTIETAEELSTYLENLVQTNDIPGFSVSVALENSIAYQKSFGYANIATVTPYTNQTVNSIASISKTFVGAATAKAIEQGYFTLETNINELLPIEINNPKQPSSPIKIKHLVTHTSGIVDIPSVYLANNYYILPGENSTTEAATILMNGIGIQQSEKVALDEYLAEIFLEDGELYSLDNYLDAAPGEEWMYSNTGTGLLSYIIEYVSDTSFDGYVKTNILNPLQMSNTTYDIYEVNTSNLATLYLNPNSSLPRYGNHSYAEGSIHTTNEDLGNYLLDMMRGARGESAVLFSPEYYNLLFNENLESGIVPNSFAENHGLFWYMKDDNLMHGGNSIGISSHLQLKQNGASGFFIITNMDGTFTENNPKWESVKNQISNAIQQFINNN
ncbi:serine hydrolase domain-containing protein [uncultured Kordia sp.]|uniref:serine hydrolase domain-containing protein n=1 Tax=uncultured Kordia sp. TaxID=507699 RepID=UPI002637AC9A|nr:serine hydrolase domain-containing protein [uncultured Kordia sp.]